ncbi:septal ring lytic transglycosylase RlpA family protein [Neorhizobium galegae]|uniref:septal ring lytic transglycosylase RlpA family protein n=1 Tax=Neorhizobium galegae TaxID=399 RepID=UPI002100E388|nr:septal ring lytic transglycosylase RlpA family protein [Neorhizobium galegae]MCQ1572125.1 septal ring lytic transglycosylase RlpA family protein [Neorhizobium galegae]
MSLGVSGGKLSLGAKWLGITMVCAGMASCATTEAPKSKPRSKEYFSEKEYGVKASPRVVGDGRPVPKGGGRFMVGQPYEVKGQTYVPKEDPNYNRSGLASWYGSAFHGRLTANGEVYDSDHLSAAHPTFPLPSYARVTNIDNGTSVIVRVNDRGPYHPGRIIDVSDKTAEMLDMKRIGTAKVNVQYVGRARMDGKDMPFLMASYIRKGDRLPSIRPEGQIATGVMVASNQTLGDQLQSYGSAMPRPMALAGRTPSGPAPAASAPQAFEAFENFSTLPQVGPRPIERPVAGVAPAQNRQAASSYPVEAQARPSQGRSLETAYSSAPQAKTPQVVFGNMVLEGPKAAQKPVR